MSLGLGPSGIPVSGDVPDRPLDRAALSSLASASASQARSGASPAHFARGRTVRIDAGLKAKCPGVALGILVAQITTRTPPADLLEEMKSSENEILRMAEPRTILECPKIQSTRAAYRTLGKDPSRYRPSAEALLRRILSGKGFPQINTAVDIVNLVCVESHLPIGLYDLARIQGEIVFRVGREGETYTGIGKFALNLEGLSVLCDDAGPHGSPTRDSERTMVTSSTEHVTAILISFAGIKGLAGAGERIGRLFQKYAGAPQISFQITS